MDPSRDAILVKDKHSLQREKARLRRLCGEMEEEGQNRLLHVKKHYGTMAFNTVFPQARTQATVAKFIGLAAKSAFKKKRIPSMLLMAAITTVEIVGTKKIIGFFEELFDKKKDKQKEKKNKEEKDDAED